MMPRPVVTLADMDRVVTERPPVADRTTHALPVERVHPSPNNPRHDHGDLDELAASLEAHGLLQPILVRPVDREGGQPSSDYELIAGHRRLAAAKQLGWQHIECVVREAELDEAHVLTLVENLHRDNLSAREEAAGLETLLRERNWSVRQVAEAVRRDPGFVSRRLRVFDDPVLAPYVLRNQVPVALAEAVLPLPPKQRGPLIEHAVAGGWSRADMRRAVAEAMQPYSGRRPHGLTAQIRALRKTLEALQPADLTDSDRAELLRLFTVGQFLGRRKPRKGPPVIPKIEGGAAFVDDRTEEPEPAGVG